MYRIIGILVLVVAGVAVFVVGRGYPETLPPAWRAPHIEQIKKNPEKDKPVTAATKTLAETNCVVCHGKKGKGDGLAASALNPKPADWSAKKVQEQTDGELFWKITHGRGAMPPWKHLSMKERWELVNYLRSFKHEQTTS